jgi:acetate---CoA ligase (ADP-forming)
MQRYHINWRELSMTRKTTFDELDPLFHPGSVALIGASAKPGKVGRLFMDCFMEMEFRELYPVNPREQEILGIRSYPSVLLIPCPVDMAIVATPTASALAMVKECIAKGVKTIVINTSGFAESGEKGRKAQEEMVRVAREGGARIIGPNCIGIYCPASKLPFLLRAGKVAGSVGLVSQSGFFADYLTVTATANGIGFSKAISCGNESDLTAVDFLEYLGEDPETRTIVAYLESMKDGRRFYDAAREVSKRKPVILLRGGLTEGGARAAVSHTGAIAGSSSLWEGVVRHTGIVTAQSFEEVLDCLSAFHLHESLPKGTRVGIVSGPGGIAVTATDRCLEMGLSVPQFSEAITGKLRSSLPLVGGSVENPIDLSLASLVGPHVYAEAIKILMEEEGIDMILVISIVGGERLRDIILDGTSGSDKQKPIAVVVMAGTAESVGRDCRMLPASGISLYPDALRAVKALHKLSEYARFRRQVQGRSRDTLSGPRKKNRGISRAMDIIRNAAGEGRNTLSEHESKEILKDYGIPVVREMEAFDEEEFSRALDEIGFPMVIKAAGLDLTHKTEQGLVFMDIRTKKEARAVYREIMSKRKGVPTSVIVQELVKGRRELIVGLTRDPSFGPCVMVGMGGIFSEVLNDTAIRVAPIEKEEALEMIGEIKGRKSLGLFRGMEAADLDKIADIVVKVGSIGIDLPEAREIDINPVIISSGKPIAVDALIVLSRG